MQPAQGFGMVRFGLHLTGFASAGKVSTIS